MLTPSPAQLDLIDFIANYGQIYAGMPTIAETVYLQKLTEADRKPAHLFKRFHQIADGLDIEQKLEILKNCDDIRFSEAPSPIAAPAPSLTEMAGASRMDGTDLICDPDNFAELRKLHTAYRKKFGFPLLIHHANLSLHDITQQIRQRLEHTPHHEFKFAFQEVHRRAQQVLINIYRAQQSSLKAAETMPATSTP